MKDWIETIAAAFAACVLGLVGLLAAIILSPIGWIAAIFVGIYLVFR